MREAVLIGIYLSPVILPIFVLLNIRMIMEGTKRSNIKIGQLVNIVLKADQRTGDLTEGVVKNILTKSPNHPHGIKVRLETGEVGRVKEILEDVD